MYREIVSSFIDTPAARPLLGLLYGRRRIGKSTLLVNEVETRNGFYFEATRVSTRVQLDRLGTKLGDHLGVGRIALDTWEQALQSLLALGRRALLRSSSTSSVTSSKQTVQSTPRSPQLSAPEAAEVRGVKHA
jgi:AAA+ ATPase superfamily predicted ATPase